MIFPIMLEKDNKGNVTATCETGGRKYGIQGLDTEKNREYLIGCCKRTLAVIHKYGNSALDSYGEIMDGDIVPKEIQKIQKEVMLPQFEIINL